MPFKSKSQLRTCYGSKRKGWDCNKWLKETSSVCSLPEKVSSNTKIRRRRVGERIVGKIQTGPRGGKFFVITEKDKRGVICKVKVYCSK